MNKLLLAICFVLPTGLTASEVFVSKARIKEFLYSEYLKKLFEQKPISNGKFLKTKPFYIAGKDVAGYDDEYAYITEKEKQESYPTDKFGTVYLCKVIQDSGDPQKEKLDGDILRLLIEEKDYGILFVKHILGGNVGALPNACYRTKFNEPNLLESSSQASSSNE
ncbi:MAG: hypothetical protein M1114_05190 [Candidatus Dependentiae bacterium]|nr:hypothetical protein [Candidatus Dependentiae bacterium]